MLSAALSGLAGAVKALVFQLASLTDAHWTMSGEVVLMTLLGGLGTVFGPVVGAFVIIALENYLAEFGPYFTDRYRTPWGRAINFDGPASDEVRRFFVESARFWASRTRRFVSWAGRMKRLAART